MKLEEKSSFDSMNEGRRKKGKWEKREDGEKRR